MPALGNWVAQRGAGIGGGGNAAAGNGSGAAAPPADGQQAAPPVARGAYDMQRVRDCLGLPAPTGSSAVVALGFRQCVLLPASLSRPTSNCNTAWSHTDLHGCL